MYEAVIDAAAELYGDSLKTNLLCRYNEVMLLYESVACDCTASGQDQCFAGNLQYITIIQN
jgi:hypothetical protein